MTRRGVWDIQDVRDKLLAGDPWERYNAAYTGGWNGTGQLGQGDIGGSATALAEVLKVPTTAESRNWTSVRSIARNKFGITSDGELFSWGYNVQGQLGQNQGYPPWYGGYKSRSAPTQIPGTTWDSVAGGNGRYGWMATKTDGTLWYVGGNEQHQSGGWGPNTRHYSSPIQVPGTDWAKNNGQAGQWKITNSTQSQFAIKTTGVLHCCGRNDIGNLGLNTGGPTIIAYPMPGSTVGSDTTWQYIAAGGYDTYDSTWAIKTDGTLWAWGSNDLVGALGLNDLNPKSSPTQVGTNTNWASVSGAQGHPWGNTVMAMKTDGTVWCWGYNNFGASGTNQGPTSPFAYSSPRQTPGTWDMAVTVGNASLLHKPDGTGWICGDVWAAGMTNPVGGQYMSSPVQLPSAITWDKAYMDLMGGPNAGGSSMSSISPNLTPTQV